MEQNCNYVKEKRNIEDRCNICGKVSKLTWDHVPPKFCFNSTYVKYNSLLNKVNQDAKMLTGQNGIKYRSICGNCNSNILGSNYDKEYEKLVNILHDIYIKPGEIAQYLVIQGLKINKIARAVVGHFLASRNDYFEGPFENELREYFLDEKLLPPRNVQLLYYTYIYNIIMIIRDIAPKKLGGSEYPIPEGLVSCLNTFPLSFVLVNKSDNDCGLYDMFKICTGNIDDIIDLKIDLLSYMYPNHKYVRDPYWPCNVSDDETGTDLVLMGEGSTNSSVLTQIRNLKIKENKAKYEVIKS